MLDLARRIKKQYPHVLIEMHDPVTGPSSIRYTPTYFGYAPPQSFDCLWGHEFMWNPLDDLLSRRAVSLYYYNLAYSIPLYLHVNLKGDNENALVFWWYASTCRHLGVGGKPPGAVWEAEKKAMQAYQPLKRFYTQGVFYGVDEMTHAHTLPDLQESVINAFNLEKEPVQKPVRFRLAEIGLRSGRVQVEGAPFQQSGEEVTLDLAIPARGHQLLKVRTVTGNARIRVDPGHPWRPPFGLDRIGRPWDAVVEISEEQQPRPAFWLLELRDGKELTRHALALNGKAPLTG